MGYKQLHFTRKTTSNNNQNPQNEKDIISIPSIVDEKYIFHIYLSDIKEKSLDKILRNLKKKN